MCHGLLRRATIPAVHVLRISGQRFDRENGAGATLELDNVAAQRRCIGRVDEPAGGTARFKPGPAVSFI